MQQSSDPDKKRFLKLTDYFIEITVKASKSFLLWIGTLMHQLWRFLNANCEKKFS